MDFMRLILEQFGGDIVYYIMSGVLMFLGFTVKNIYKNHMNDKRTRLIAKSVVEAVEQLYQELNGEEKLERAIEDMDRLLVKKGIDIDEFEMRVLIESQLAELKNIFTNTETPEKVVE